jgi:uroporphyrinogen III methyltransferase/synthase
MTTTPTQPPLAVLAGAGPGDGELATLAAVKWVSRADVIIHDRLGAAALLAHARADCEIIDVGKAPGGGPTQQEICSLLVAKCLPGKIVVRLKGGDPMIFGRCGEELAALRSAGIPFRIVPGVTAALAAAAGAGIPLTDRRLASSVAFITGQEDPAKEQSTLDWVALAKLHTLVFYMGVSRLEEIARQLCQAGRPADTPVAVVQDASLPRQRTITGTLADIAQRAQEAGIQPPALTIVGQVAAMHGQYNWRAALPLAGQCVLVTRTRRQSSELAGALAELGAEVIEAPTIEIAPPADAPAVDAALRRVAQFDWLIITSPNGADVLFARLDALKMDARSLSGVKVAAVGDATAAALALHGIRADLVPESFTTADLGGTLLASVNLRGKKLLLARADIAAPQLAAVLRQNGAIVEDLALYRTTRPAALPPAAALALRQRRVNWATFTSSSTVDNFLALAATDQQIDLSGVRLAAIGPVTADALRAHGLQPTVVAGRHTIADLAAAIAHYMRHQ